MPMAPNMTKPNVEMAKPIANKIGQGNRTCIDIEAIAKQTRVKEYDLREPLFTE